MDQKLIECTETPQNYNARVVKSDDGSEVVEIWDLAGGEFPEVIKLTPYEVFYLGESIEGTISEGEINLFDCEKNHSLIKTYGFTNTRRSKQEVTKQEFINIINK